MFGLFPGIHEVFSAEHPLNFSLLAYRTCLESVLKLWGKFQPKNVYRWNFSWDTRPVMVIVTVTSARVMSNL